MRVHLNSINQHNFDEMERKYLDCPDSTEHISPDEAVCCDNCGCIGTSNEIQKYFTNINGEEVYETLCENCAKALGYTEGE